MCIRAFGLDDANFIRLLGSYACPGAWANDCLEYLTESQLRQVKIKHGAIKLPGEANAQFERSSLEMSRWNDHMGVCLVVRDTTRTEFKKGEEVFIRYGTGFWGLDNEDDSGSNDDDDELYVPDEDANDTEVVHLHN